MVFSRFRRLPHAHQSAPEFAARSFTIGEDFPSEPRSSPRSAAVFCCIVCDGTMHLILFVVFAGLCLAGAINLLLQSHPINSALSLVVVMSSLAGLYLMLGAEFLAAAQVVLYAGAIMVLFTFVV